MHHSLCDGISVVALNLSLDNVYDLDKLVRNQPVSLWKRTILRALIPLSALQVLFRTLTTS